MTANMDSEKIREVFGPLPDLVQAEYRQRGVYFLEDGYLADPLRIRYFYPRIYDAVREEADRLRKDPPCAYELLLTCRAMEERDKFSACEELFPFREEYPLMPFLCLLPFMDRLYAHLREKALPEDVVQKTVGQFEACVFLHRDRYDCLGLHVRYFHHLQLYVDQKILNISALRFEMLTLEDPVYVLEEAMTGRRALCTGVCLENLSGCRVILRPGDYCLSVHIPDGGDISPAACEDSYARAIRLFARYAPDWKPKAFHCESWMLSPELKEMLSEGSNILAFQQTYERYAIPSEGKDVLNFVFKMKFHTYADLAEDTSLRRALKKLYCSGGVLHEYGGIRMI